MVSPRTLEFDIDDNGTINVLIGKARRFQRKALRDIEQDCDWAAREYQQEVRNRAQGRPGPRRITGGYWESIQVETVRSIFLFSFQKRVVSHHPAAARLEKGFVDVDALGRHYAQPPYAHWYPAIQIIGPRWTRRYQNIGPKWWRES